MRHFRNVKEIEDFMIAEYARQGIAVAYVEDIAIVPIVSVDATGKIVRTAINVSRIAAVIWEGFSR